MVQTEIERYLAVDRDFIEPASFPEAERRLNEATANIVQIQNELGLRRRYRRDGSLMSVEEFEQWHDRAKRACMALLHVQRGLKLWIHEHPELRPVAPERQGDWGRRDLVKVAVAAQRYIRAVQSDERGETPIPGVESCFAALEVAVQELPERPA